MQVVVLRVVRMADQKGLRRSAAFGGTKVRVRVFVRDVDQSEEAEVLHLPDIVVVANIADVSKETFGRDAQMEIARHGSRVEICRDAGIVTGNIGTAMIHDVVEVDAEPEAMGDGHHVLQLLFSSVAGADSAALVLVAEIEGIKEIVTDGKLAPAFGGRWEPQARVTRLGDLRKFVGDLIPREIEELEHGVAARGENGHEKD